MRVLFVKAFEKEISKIKDKKLALSVQFIINTIAASESLRTVANVKKLEGHKFAYRIRLGHYRIGFYYQNDVVTFAAFGYRKDIYKKFP